MYLSAGKIYLSRASADTAGGQDFLPGQAVFVGPRDFVPAQLSAPHPAYLCGSCSAQTLRIGPFLQQVHTDPGGGRQDRHTQGT